LPCQFLTLSSSILNENFLDSCLVSIYIAEVKRLKVLFTENCRSSSFGFQDNVLVFSIFHHEMKNIIELTCIISIADDIEIELLSWFQESMLHLWLEDRNLLPGKSMELSLNFGVVDD
jgi:hypothetical protein